MCYCPDCGADIIGNDPHDPNCPKDQRENATFIVTTGTVPSREIPVIGQAAAAALADETNGSYYREW